MCVTDYPKAIQFFEKLKTDYPNDAELYFWISMVYRRMGEFAKSFEYNKQAIALNPSHWLYWLNAGLTLQMLAEYDESESYQRKVIDLNPSVDDTYWYILKIYSLKGEIKKAKEFSKLHMEFIDRPFANIITSHIEILDGNFDEAIRIIESISDSVINDHDYFSSIHLQLGLIHYMMSNENVAVKHFEAERVFLEEKLLEFKNDSRILRSLGIAYAGLGEKSKAIEAGRKAVEILGYHKDALTGFYNELDLARILVMVGEYNEALTILEFLLDHTGYFSVELLKIDPFWDPIKEMDEYNELISNPKYQSH